MRETTEENDAEQAEHFQNALFLLPIDVLSGEDCRFLEQSQYATREGQRVATEMKGEMLHTGQPT